METTTLTSPPDYEIVVTQPDYCTDRFSIKYLEELRDNAVEYCQPGSRSTFTCFHSHRAENGKTDSMCIGRGAVFDSSGKFTLDCSIRQLSSNEVAQGLLPFKSIRGYWYDTGPPHVLDKAVRLSAARTGRGVDGAGQQGKQIRHRDGSSARGVPQFYFLLQREGDANTWHSLMEIWSSWLTIDVLRMAGHPSRDSDNTHTP